MKVKLSLAVLLFTALVIASCSAAVVKTLPPPEVTIDKSTPQLPIFTETAAEPAISGGQVQNTAQPQATSTLIPTAVASPTLRPTAPELSVSPSPTSTNPAVLPAPTETPSATVTPTPQSASPAATVAAPAQASPSIQASSTAQACQDQAAFYSDVTIPDDTSFRQGVNFVKTWQIKNTGTCTWGPGYSLIFAGGDIMNGPQSVPLPKVNPGDIFDVSVNLTSPANGGVYLGDWEFQRPDGTRFGVNSDGVDMIWVKISVSYIVVGPTATPNPISATCTGQTNSDYINIVLSLINQARAANNLPALTLNAKLSAAAQAHSNDMACNDFIDHVGSDGSTWFTRIQAQGYTYSYASENIYVGNPAFGGDANGAFTWWMNSQVHRDNILSPKITQIGIGYTFYTKATYGGYYTVDFAHP